MPRRANACAAVEDHISTEARFGFSQCGAGPWSQAKSSSRMESLFCAVLVRIAPQHIPSCCFEPCQCGTSILRAPRRPKDRHTERIREALLWPPMSEPVPTASPSREANIRKGSSSARSLRLPSSLRDFARSERRERERGARQETKATPIHLAGHTHWPIGGTPVVDQVKFKGTCTVNLVQRCRPGCSMMLSCLN